MIVTINTDASFHHSKKVGGYAFYIICNRGKILKSGPIKEADSPMDCEMKAIANALYLFSKSDLNVGVSKIIINSDCLFCFQYIKSKSNKPVGKYIYNRIKQIHRKSKGWIEKHSPINKFYELRHVKAHVEIKDARSWVNDWCDKEAKKQMRLQLKETTKQ